MKNLRNLDEQVKASMTPTPATTLFQESIKKQRELGVLPQWKLEPRFSGEVLARLVKKV